MKMGSFGTMQAYMKIWGVLTQKGGLWVTDDKNYGTFSKEWGSQVKAPH